MFVYATVLLKAALWRQRTKLGVRTGTRVFIRQTLIGNCHLHDRIKRGFAFPADRLEKFFMA